MTILPAVLCAFILSASVFAPARAEEITERQPDVTTDRTVDVENTYKNIQANKDGGVFFVRSTLTFNAAATFLNNASERSGGAIYIAGKEGIAGTVNFNADATFTKNSAGNGGAVFNESALNFNGGTYTFENNAATANVGNGGAIYNAGRINFGTDDKRVSLTFTNNTAMEGGGAIFNTNGGVVTIKGDATFSGDADAEAVMKYGGAVRNKDDASAAGSQFIVDGAANFYNNKVSWGGGALSNDTNSLFSVFGGAMFEGNTAGLYGGAIYNKGTVSFGGLAEFNGNKTDNATETYGGAFYNHTTGTFTANAGAKFTNNTAGAHGGAVYNGGSFTLKGDATFTDNTANGNGGAFFNNGTISFVNGAKFKNNSAGKQGGAVYNNGTASFGGITRFESNTVSGEEGKGGAVYNGTDGVLTFADDVSFVNNTATGERYSDGGAIYNEGTINFGTDEKRVNVTFENNSAKDGGGSIFNRNGGVVTIRGSAIFSSDADAAAVAKYGGAIRNYKDADADGSQFIVDGDATFTNSKALLNGGALSNGEGSLFSVSGNATFTNNSAGENGGAISSMGTLAFGKENETSLTQFLGNTAQNGSGGAIFNYTSGSLTFYGDAAFKDNSAKTSGGSGGAIYNLGTLNFYGSSYTFANNTAESGTPNDIYNNGNKGVMNIGVAGKTTDFNVSRVAGTGTTNILGNVNLNAANAEKTIDWQNHIDVASGATLTVSDAATFSKTTDGAGGAIRNKGTVHFKENVLFEENTSETNGGAIYNTGNMTFSGGGVFQNNKTLSNYGGGAIYNSGHLLFEGSKKYTFEQNYASIGGTIQNSGELVMTADADFIQNKGTYVLYNTGTMTFGGAAYSFASNEVRGIWNSGTMRFSNADGSVKFTDNKDGTGGAVYVVGGSVIFDGMAEFLRNTGSKGGAAYTADKGTLTFNGSALFDGNTAQVGGAIYNLGTLNFYGSSYTFANNTAESGTPNDIYNNGNKGVMNIGVAGKTTDFNVSHVTGTGTTNIFGNVNLNAANAEKTIDWRNRIYVGRKSTQDEFGKLNINDDITFSGNSCENCRGGAISSGSVKQIDINANAAFKSNSAGHGGAYYLGTQGGKMKIFGNALFQENKAMTGNGGAIAGAAAYNHTTIVGTAGFIVNEAQINGGAVYLSIISDLTLESDASFLRNIAHTGDGGAIYANAWGHTYLNGDVLFDGNAAKGENSRGGAVYAQAHYAFNVLKNATFTGNYTGEDGSTGKGGAIYAVKYQETISQLTFGNGDDEGKALFDGNKSGDGGAIYSDAGSTLTSTKNYAFEFINNTAKNYGGAIFNAGTIKFNGSAVFTDNKAAHGGAAANKSNLTLVKGATFKKNYASVNGGALNNGGTFVSDGDLWFEENESGLNGGAVYNTSSGNFSVNGNATFIKNKSQDGSALINFGTVTFGKTALFKENFSETSVSDGTVWNKGIINFNGLAEFIDNTAYVTSGAIYNDVNGNVNFNAGATFTSNTTGTSGGAVYNKGRLNFNAGATFTGNSVTASSSKGGAIYNLGTLYFNSGDVRFDGNTSQHDGAAVYNASGGVIHFKSNTVFDGNEGFRGALCNSGTVNFTGGATFKNNKSTGNGGAIYNDGTISFSDAEYVFENNTMSGKLFDIYNLGTLNIGGTQATVFKAASILGSGMTNITGTGTVDFFASSGSVLTWENYINIASGATLTVNDNFLSTVIKKDGFGDVILNKGTLNFKGATNEFKTAGTGSEPNNIRNDSVMNIGVAGSTTDFNVSHVTGTGTTNILGNVNLNAANATQDSAGKIYWQNHINVAGGAILNVNDAAIFSNSVVASFGGSMLISNGGQVFLNAPASFESNQAAQGGAIFITGGGLNAGVSGQSGTFVFKGNRAIGDGGAIKNSGGANFYQEARFESNTAGGNSGAIFNESNFIAYAHMTFANNTGSAGGAIYNIKNVYFNDSATFTGNTASTGGAIYNLGALNFNGSFYTFANNKAGGNLNDIYNDGVMNIGVAGKTTDFNVSYVTGTGTTNILGTVNLNAANAEKTIDWQNHIDVAGGAALTVNDGADFKNGTAQDGGALNVHQNGKAEFNGVTSFKGNHGNNNGGAILNYGNLVFNNTATFDGNSGITGGGIANGGTLIINAFADFKNNEANTYGGALNNYGGKAYLNASANFENNSVSQRGGAVYNHSTSEITFAGDSYTFKNNKVGGRGFNDIYNDGVMNVGVAGKTTGFNISYISNRQTRNITAQTNFFGTVNLKATNDNDLIDFKNRMVLKSGVTLNVLSDIVVTGYTKDMASSEYGGGISMGGGVFNALGNVTIKDNFVNGQGGGIDMTGGVMTLGSAGKTVRFENNFSYYGGAARLVGGTLNIDGKAEFVGNSTGRGSAVYLEYATLNLNGDALFENNPSSTAAIYNMAGKVNFNASSYEFKNNKVGDSYGDIYNNGNILIGNDKTDTSFTISFVDGSGVTEFRGGKTVEMRAASGNVISFKNNVTVTEGTTLGIGQNLFDMGDKNLTLTSEGTLKLTISDLAAGSSDYTGGQFKTAGTATIGGTLFVTIDPSVSLIGETGELTLVDAGTFSGVFADWKISNGYTIRYVGDGKFIIGKSDDPDPTPPSPPDPNPPAPTPEPPAQDTEFVKPAKEVAISDVRAGVAQITDRLSSLGASMSVSPASTASPASNQGRSGGDDAADISLWAKALYTSTDLRGATKMDSDGYGFIIGADGGASGDLYLGAALGYTHNKGDTDLSHFKSETYLGYLYGRYALTRKTGLTGTIGYGFTQFDLDAATGKFNAHTINAQATADYALPAHLTAEIAARYTFSAMDAYTTGTTKVAAQDTHTGTVLAGLRYRRNVGGFVVKANAGALYDVYSDAADYRLTQSGAASYARGERLHRFGGEVGAGIGCEGEAFGVEADYNAQVRKDYNDQTVSVKLVYRFNAPKARRKTAAGGKVTAVPAAPAQHKVAEPIASPVQNKVDAPPAAVPASPTPVQNKVTAVPAAVPASPTPVQNKVTAVPAAVPASPTPASHKAAAPATPAQHKVAEPIASPVQHKVVPASPTPVAPPAAAEAEIIEAYCVSMRRALRRYYGIEAE